MITVKIKKIIKRKFKEPIPVYDIISNNKNHNFIANGVVVHNCDLYARGTGALFVKDKNPNFDSWRMKEFDKLGTYTEFTSTTKIANILKKHPNFWQVIKFPKIHESLYQRYMKVRESNVYDDQNVLDTINKQDIIRAMLIVTLKEILVRDSTLSVKRLLLHLQNEYGVEIRRETFDDLMRDAEMLVAKIKENNLAKVIT